jgi:uncharacterized protein (TIGR00369 family)
MPDDSYDLLEAINMLKTSYEEHMPFNRFLGLKIVTLDTENVSVKVKMKEGLIGNFIRGMIHGGVISSLIDIVGGLLAAAQVIKKMDGMPAKDLARRIERVSTVDIRVDYLIPGIGDYFLCNGSVIRMGEKVATIGMELSNDGGEVIALGRGTYLVG